MRKLFISTLCSLFLLTSAFSQNNLDKWGISFTPNVILSTPTSLYGLQPGVALRLSPRLTLVTELNLGIALKKDSFYTNGKYFRIKPELRYNFQNRHRWFGNYIGLQLSYTYRSWENRSPGSYFRRDGFEDTAITYGSATITSPILTSSIQTGTIFNIGEHFSFDVFSGIGVRTIFTEYNDVTNPAKQTYFRPTCGIYIPMAYRINRTVARLQLNAGLRFLYYF